MRARFGPGELTVLIAAGAAMAVLAATAYLIAPPDTTPRVPGSSYSTEPDGARAAYLLLSGLGHELTRSVEPVASLRLDPARTTLVLAQPAGRPAAADRDALRRFVADGGIVIAFGLAADAFLPDVTPNDERRRAQPVEAFPAALPGRLTHGLRELSASRSPKPRLGPAYAVVYGTADNVAVVTARIGRGAVVWCLDETVVQNGGIARGQNVALLVNAAGRPGQRRIAWDEHYHGQRRSFWSYVAGTPLIWGGAQLALVAATMMVAAARRRGPLRPRVREPRASPLEFIDTMASLYERADNAGAAVEQSRDRLRRHLAAVAGLPQSSTDQDLTALAAPRIGLETERTSAALAASAAALRRGVSGGNEAVPLVAELQELAAAAAAARRGKGEAHR